MHPLLIPEGSDGERALGRFKGYTFVFISIMSVVSTSFKMAWGGTIILFKVSFFLCFSFHVGTAYKAFMHGCGTLLVFLERRKYLRISFV